MFMLALALQSVAGPAAGYDTGAVTRACGTGSDDGAIIVCGSRKNDKYRLKPLATDDPRFGRAETSFAGAKVGVETEQATVGGFPSNRVMARLKIKF